MSTYRIFFVSGNVEKLRDILDIVGSLSDLRIDHFEFSIEELQTEELSKLVQEKAIAAFNRVRHPVIVDHTCLGLSALRGLPGTAASHFWKCLGTDVCGVVSKLGDDRAEVTVALAFTDGKRMIQVQHKQKGQIAAAPKGSREFDWDRVFIPQNEIRTYAEMSLREKNENSPRARAFLKLVREIRKLT